MPSENDFSKLSRFPGETGNFLDIILHRFAFIQHIPMILFAGLLLGLALPPTLPDFRLTLILFGFYLLDWSLIAYLPRANRSFGPPQPPVVILAVLRMFFAFIPLPWGLVIQLAGTVLVIISFWIEPFHVQLSQQKLVSPKLAQGVTLRVLHLGDLHIERITQRERTVQRTIDRLKPDLILFSGDILNLSYRSDQTAIEAARQVLRQWQAPLGVFVVSGSPAVDLPAILPKILSDLPLRWLQNEKIELLFGNSTINLVGLNCTHRPHIDGACLERLMSEKSPLLTVLLYHTPDLAPIAARLGVDLQLSGHTHGGQIRIPGFGALITGSLYGKKFEAGRYKIKEMILYVTRGLGLEGAAAPRMRLFCPPEIILWEITGNSTSLT